MYFRTGFPSMTDTQASNSCRSWYRNPSRNGNLPPGNHSPVANEYQINQLHHYYRQRFGIETSYRLKNHCRIRTTTKNPVLRLLFVALAFILVNLWVYLMRAFHQSLQTRRAACLPCFVPFEYHVAVPLYCRRATFSRRYGYLFARFGLTLRSTDTQ